MQAPLCEACYEILLRMNQFKKENCGPFSHLKPAIVQICTSARGGAVIPTGGNTLCKLSAPSSVAHSKLPGKGGGGLNTAAADIGRPGRKEPSWQSQQSRRPRPRPAQADHPPRACPHRHETERPPACLRLRRGHVAPACGVRRKGRTEREQGAEGAVRCGAVRPREGECATPCALRPGVGPLRPAPGVSPAVGGAPWRLAGGNRGGCG